MRAPILVYAGAGMYDVYISSRKDLLVVLRGAPIPSELTGTWRKKKRTARSVNKEIREDIQARGYYCRKLVPAVQAPVLISGELPLIGLSSVDDRKPE
jgi:hypothetical protein